MKKYLLRMRGSEISRSSQTEDRSLEYLTNVLKQEGDEIVIFDRNGFGANHSRITGEQLNAGKSLGKKILILFSVVPLERIFI